MTIIRHLLHLPSPVSRGVHIIRCIMRPDIRDIIDWYAILLYKACSFFIDLEKCLREGFVYSNQLSILLVKQTLCTWLRQTPSCLKHKKAHLSVVSKIMPVVVCRLLNCIFGSFFLFFGGVACFSSAHVTFLIIIFSIDRKLELFNCFNNSWSVVS